MTFEEWWKRYCDDEGPMPTSLSGEEVLWKLKTVASDAWLRGAGEYGMCIHCLGGELKSYPCHFCKGTGRKQS